MLIDDSRSMTIADRDGQPRTAFVQQQFGRPEQPAARGAVEAVRRCASSASRRRPTALASAGDLQYAGTATHLGPALERARDELSGLPLAGLVMVTDGADTSDAVARRIARQPQGAVDSGVHGRRRPGTIRARHPDHPRRDAALHAQGHLARRGRRVSGRPGTPAPTVPLHVEDEGRIVSSQDVTLPPDGESATVRVNFTANDAGPRLFRFSIAPQAGEQVTQNNARDALVEVLDRRENGAVHRRRAALRDEVHPARGRGRQEPAGRHPAAHGRRTSTCGSTSANPDELVGGFPKTREELFAYRAIILGSVEAASFTPDQLRMLADFVSKRGGGLLMLGGRRSFAEGGWAGTPVAEVLPVEFDAAAARQARPTLLLAQLTVHPTRAGATYPVTQLADTEKASTAKWDEHAERHAPSTRFARSSRAPRCS